MKAKKRHVVLFLAALVLATLAGTVTPASVAGQAPPSVLGPGWHLGAADPVSPAEARRVLARRQVAASRAVASLATSET